MNKGKERKRKKERPLFVVNTVIYKYKASPNKMVKKSLPKKATSKKANIPPSSDNVESHDDHVITKKKELDVQHPAWIPGAKLATPMQDPNFEAFKNTFSPFKFTGSILNNASISMSPADLAMFCNPDNEGESPLDESCYSMRSDTRTNGNCEYQKLEYTPYPKTLEDLLVWFYEEMSCPVDNYKHVS